MSLARKTFWTDTARGYGGSCKPRKYGLNWFMPAFVSNRVGSFGINEDEGTTLWPRSSKNFKNVVRISAAFIEGLVYRPPREALFRRSGRRHPSRSRATASHSSV